MATDGLPPGESEHERGYIEGRRRTPINSLNSAMKELREFGMDPPDYADLLKERHEAISVLRRIYNDYGADDWPPNLHLADIIERCLMRAVRASEER